MARVFWDTNLFIYLFEANDEWSPRVVELRRAMNARGDELLTSWLTVGEVLTKPRESGNKILERSYSEFFVGGAIQVVEFGAEAARKYAEIRCHCRVRPADAVQLACAAVARTDLFITNDARLSKAVAPGITFITSLTRVPY